MAKRPGIGEYERVDIGIPVSTCYLRAVFLHKLDKAHPEIFLSVLNLTDSTASIDDPSSRSEGYSTFLWALLAVRSGQFESVVDPENKPFQNYIRFISSKRQDIEARMFELRTRFPSTSVPNLERRAIHELFGTIDKLFESSDGRDLAASLRSWAASNNLLDDWILELPLLVMCNYYVALRYDTSLDIANFQSGNVAAGIEYFLRYVSKDSVRYALRTFREVLTLHKLALIDHDWEISPFEFTVGEFKFGPVTWLPYYERLADFISINETEFRRQRDPLFDNLIDSFDFSVVLAEIEKIRPTFEESKRTRRGYFEIDGLIANVPPDYSLCKVPRGHEFESIEQLISEARNQYDEKLVRAREMAFKRERRLNKKFTVSLKDYCNKVEKSCPKHYSKTPRKHDYVHFDWLIAYQFNPFRSYTSIASSRRRQEGITESTVRTAVSRLANALHLSLRPTSIGRPAGIKETKPRLIPGRA